MLVAISLIAIRVIDTRAEVIPDRQHFATFPLYFDGWRGQQENLEQIYTDRLALTDYLLNNYSKDSLPPVNFYVAYYESQRKGISPHRPHTLRVSC